MKHFSLMRKACILAWVAFGFALGLSFNAVVRAQDGGQMAVNAISIFGHQISGYINLQPDQYLDVSYYESQGATIIRIGISQELKDMVAEYRKAHAKPTALKFRGTPNGISQHSIGPNSPNISGASNVVITDGKQ